MTSPMVKGESLEKPRMNGVSAYQFHGFRRGSTNGQTPVGTVIVKTGDKALGAEAALAHLGCYKVIGLRLPAGTDLAAKAAELATLYRKPVEVI